MDAHCSTIGETPAEIGASAPSAPLPNPFRAVREPVPGYDGACALQLIRCAESWANYGKIRRLEDGRYIKVSEYASGKLYQLGAPIVTDDLRELISILEAVSHDSKVGAVHGAPRLHEERVLNYLRATGTLFRSSAGTHQLPCFHEVPRVWFWLDFDPAEGTPPHLRMIAEGIDIIKDPEGAAHFVRNHFMPPELRDVELGFHLTASAGFVDGHLDQSLARMRFLIRLASPTLPRAVKAWAKAANDELGAQHIWTTNKSKERVGIIDHSPITACNPNYISLPRFENCTDPIPCRWGIVTGTYKSARLRHRDRIAIPRAAKREPARKSGTDEQAATGNVNSDGTLNLENVDSAIGWPDTWEECVDLIGAGNGKAGFSDPLKYAAFRLVRSAMQHRPFVRATRASQIASLSDAISRMQETVRREGQVAGRDPAFIAKHVDEARRVVLWAVDTFLKDEPTCDECVPLYPDSSLSRAEAEAMLQWAISDFADWTDGWHARERALIPHALIRASTGLGKTRGFFREALLRAWAHDAQVIISVQSHKLADEKSTEIQKLAAELRGEGREIKEFTIDHIRGRDQKWIDENGRERLMCEAPPDVRSRADYVEKELQLSVRSSVCPKCPLAAECKWKNQNSDTPGFKIITHAHLASSHVAALPGTNYSPNARRSDVRTRAVLIDENPRRALSSVEKFALDHLPTPENVADGISEKLKTEKPWLERHLVAAASDVGAGLLKAKKAGRPPRYEDFTDLLRRPSTSEIIDAAIDGTSPTPRWQKLHWSLKRAILDLSNQVQSHIQKGGDPVELIARLRKLRHLSAVVLIIGGAVHDGRSHVHGLRIERTKRPDGEVEMQVRVLRTQGMPTWVHMSPALCLDATADFEHYRIFFGYRHQWPEGVLVGSSIVAASIAARAEHATFVKIIGAPVTASKLFPEKYRRSDAGQKVDGRQRRDSNIERLVRVIHAIAGRHKRVGLVCSLAVESYLTRFSLLPSNVTSLHFGGMAGSNHLQDCDLILVAGIHRPPLPEIEAEAEALHALSPFGGVVGSIGTPYPQYRPAGLRVRKGSATTAIEVASTSHPCPLVKRMYDQIVTANEDQAIGRSRDVRRGTHDPVACIVLSDVVSDRTYDHVVDWAAFWSLDEKATLLHALGVAPETAGELRRLGPQLFATAEQAKQAVAAGSVAEPSRTLSDNAYRHTGPAAACTAGPEENVTQTGQGLKGEGDTSNKGLTRLRDIKNSITECTLRRMEAGVPTLALTRDTILWGNPVSLQALRTALGTVVSYTFRKASRNAPTLRRCLADLTRPRGALEAALTTKGRTATLFYSGEEPARRKRGRPKKRTEGEGERASAAPPPVAQPAEGGARAALADAQAPQTEAAAKAETPRSSVPEALPPLPPEYVASGATMSAGGHAALPWHDAAPAESAAYSAQQNGPSEAA